jgi:hypothetical protein
VPSKPGSHSPESLAQVHGDFGHLHLDAIPEPAFGDGEGERRRSSGRHIPTLHSSASDVPAVGAWAEFEAEGISLRFRFGFDLLREIDLEVRGRGDSLPLIRKLQNLRGR